ncbi:DEAD/DEAH box helicase [Microvirga sp. RSM25]|uniref:DEAD/DEAH box helicase n=1 Tax=Microvirga sp. RSM25 TaxID=3273802 RepID=UPI003851748D
MTTVPASAVVVSYNGQLRAVIRSVQDFGFETYDLAAAPRRLLSARASTPLVESGVDVRRVEPVPSPSELLQGLPHGESWLGVSQRTMARVLAAFLVGEDPQRRLDAQSAATLMHQLSLVQHVLENPSLRKVLIADEVGLGKTIEAGLIVKRVSEGGGHLRVLYLAPARLVSNVAFEFRDKLNLDARCWVAGSAADARLSDDRLVVASIHKAVFGDNLQKVVESGPWDVIVVDECHHLSDWGWDGGKPNRSFRLVSQLVRSLPTNGRLILMSGTPHQGSEARFRNILRLLNDDGQSLESSAGRVIFRTKDRVRDWKGQPLFPGRDVRSPVVVQLGAGYERWYENVGLLYEGSFADGARGRASAWAKGQALQWAASSVQAGLGYLVRLAMRRLGWTLKNERLREAIAALRPYRGGKPDEPLDALFARLQKQVGAQVLHEDVLGDDEDVEEEEWRPDPQALEALLRDGVALLQTPAANAKWDALVPLIDAAEDERIVFFAQPVETVAVVAAFLEQRYGQKPSVIIGNQSEEERRSQVAAFQADGGRRFLVSSRAGGEGLNMQRARRLIHLDVPWNPMELEQRIGRVHRFGSRRTVIVDTVVAAGSREVQMYRAAREKLRLITRQLDPEQFELLFSRVMSLVAPKELEELLSHTPIGQMSASASNELGQLVSKGYEAWRAFDDAYRTNAEQIQSLSGGEAAWADLGQFLIKHCGAEAGPNTTRTSFTFDEDEIVTVDETLPTIRFDGALYACGDVGGIKPEAVNGEPILQLGLNIPEVSNAIRRAFFPDRPCGAAYLTRPSRLPSEVPNQPFGLVYFLRQSLRFGDERPTEERLSFHCYCITNSNSNPRELSSREAASLVRRLFDAARIKEPQPTGLEPLLVAAEASFASALRRPTEDDFNARVRHVAWPIATVVVV